MNTESQDKEILKHLKKGYSLTPIEALNKFGSFRLGARIFSLKKQGHNITTTMIEVGEKKKRIASYKLVIPQPKQASIF